VLRLLFLNLIKEIIIILLVLEAFWGVKIDKLQFWSGFCFSYHKVGGVYISVTYKVLVAERYNFNQLWSQRSHQI
jgi:hypothetical protein